MIIDLDDEWLKRERERLDRLMVRRERENPNMNLWEKYRESERYNEVVRERERKREIERQRRIEIKRIYIYPYPLNKMLKKEASSQCIYTLCNFFRQNKIDVIKKDIHFLVEIIRWSVSYGTEKHLSRVGHYFVRKIVRSFQGKMLNFLEIKTNKVLYLYDDNELLVRSCIANSLYDLIPKIRDRERIIRRNIRKSVIFELDAAFRRICNNFNLLIDNDVLLHIYKFVEPYQNEIVLKEINYPTDRHIERYA